jgi:hypothetical protein
MLNTTLDFYRTTRELFPELAERADREYVKYWDERPEEHESSYSWFASVANALNKEMCRGLFSKESAAFFDYVNAVLSQCGDEVANCIDVSLVENLFWQVSPNKASPYWKLLPPQLKKLYLDFHSDPPTSLDDS